LRTKYFLFFYFLFQFTNSQVKIEDEFDININTSAVEFSFTISPDYKEILFVRTDKFYEPGKRVIYHSENINGKWSLAKIASFSGKYSDSSPFYSPCGNYILFSSKRPGPDPENTSSNIWMIHRNKNDSISYLNEVNSQSSDYSPSIDLQGNIYFGSMRKGGFGAGDIWTVQKTKNAFTKAKNLGNTINTNTGEWGSCISENGDFLIFEASDRGGNISPMGDLYYSRFINNEWTKSIALNNKVNSPGSDLTPYIHKKKLIFASNKDGQKVINNNVDIYIIDLNISGMIRD
jgi:hypothetical protein